MTIFLQGLGIKGFRSFGNKPQFIYPLGKINLFAGQNNSGKSNVLKYIKELKIGLNSNSTARGIKTTHLDIHKGKNVTEECFYLPLDLSNDNIEKILKRLKGEQASNHFDNALSTILKSLLAISKDNIIWYKYKTSNFDHIYPTINDVVSDARLQEYKIASAQEWQTVWSHITRMSGGSASDWIPPVLAALNPISYISFPEVFTISALRRIGEPTSEIFGYDGNGIILKLAELERPNAANLHLKEDFKKINSFLQEVTENDTARLEIPSDKSTILVEIDGKTLPIESLGTGIHEVIILASAATTLKNSIVCLEEPELHLHPRLQKRLINYLSENTDNQYFISTHSAHLLDCSKASVSHISMDDGESNISFAYSSEEKADICHDLGYKASDLLQTNAIIWVEGPSDRIYLNSWINQMDPKLEEGIDYSIMFYGGRLLSHLSAYDESVKDFISLKKLNRNVCILIDSDRKSENHPINETKRRIRDEFNQGLGFAWITYGREIENYIEPTLLQEAVKKVHKNVKKLESTERFSNSLHYLDNKDGIQKEIDKVAVARYVATQKVNINKDDLKLNLEKLVKFIYKANHR